MAGEAASPLDEVRAVRARLGELLADREYRGADPFDALASPLLGLAGRRVRLLGAATTVVARRLPPALRRPLLIPETVNPKTVALCALADEALGERQRAAALRSSLLALRTTAEYGAGWGYPFPWANRYFAIGAGEPNAIATVFSALPFLGLAQSGDAESTTICLDAARLLGTLNVIEGPDGTLVSYTRRDRRPVYNVAALVGSFLLRAARLAGGEERFEQLGAALVKGVERAQRPDGLWDYGSLPRDRWVDSFHSGYILRALRDAPAGASDAEVLARGYVAFSARCTAPDGAPWLMAGDPSTSDAHAAANAILTHIDVPQAPNVEAAVRIFRWMQQHLYNEATGGYWYQYRGGRAVKRDYTRWVQAWMYLALATLEGALDGQAD
ncbi:MAG: hypothetical protein QF664_09710 [Dehalococcoidia bacterium]|nr:hypothetical protein [Dehalococcoidia bacterium]